MFTLYIAGPITGVVDYEERFTDAQQRLEAAGYGTINPVALPHKNPDDWVACMKLDIATMMGKADGIALLHGWFNSEGAYLEASIARALKIQTQMLDGWLGLRSTLCL